MPKFFNSVKKEGNKLSLKILNEIGPPNWWEETVSSESVIKALDEYGEVSEIEVLINSPGGSVTEGCAIYEALKMHKAKVTVKIIGRCYSIATVIAMAGDTIEMGQTAMFMIHDPISYLKGDAKVLRNIADLLDKMKDCIINSYTTKTTLSRTKISELMTGTKYMTAKEAKELGFITDIINYSGQDIKNMADELGVLESYKYTAPNQNTATTNLEREGIMNREELLNKHPELFQKILNEGGQLERTRILDLENLKDGSTNNPANLALIKKAQFEEIKNKSEIIEALYLNSQAQNKTIATEPQVLAQQTPESTNGINFEKIKETVNEELNLPPSNSEVPNNSQETNINLAEIANLSENNR